MRLDWLLNNVRSARGENLNHLAKADVRDRFGAIYQSGVWQRGDSSNPDSGQGSSLDATHALRAQLPRLLAELKANTLLDVGCGDFTWMRSVDLGDTRYVGVDVVPGVIEEVQATYGNERRQFICANAITDDLPEADFVVCREILFHLSFADAAALLQNVLGKPRRYFAATTDSITGFNSDIATGDFRVLNLRIAPFGFSEPDWIVADDAVVPGRSFAIWRIDQLPIR